MAGLPRLRELSVERPWTQEDARRWWAEMGDDVRPEQHEAGAPPGAKAIEMDLGRRTGFHF